MKNVAEDKGSFTIEASIISIFIIVITFNLVMLFFILFDTCIIQEEIHRSMLDINRLQSEENVDNNNLKSKCDYYKLNKNLVSMKIVSVSHVIEQNTLKIEVKYKIKNNNIGALKYINNKTYTINRYFVLYDIEENVRKMKNK